MISALRIQVMTLPVRHTARLRWGRCSETSARYFVTACTNKREPVLTDQGADILRIIAKLHTEHDALVHAATVMPDHIHLLLTLGVRLRLGQLVAKVKSMSQKAAAHKWRWQDDFFERRVRTKESLEDYARYIFMNPYRSNLLRLDERWPWWFCPEESQFEFPALIGQGNAIPKEWIGDSERWAAHLRSKSRDRANL
jgi:putative transposase